MQLFIVAVGTETDVHSEDFSTEAEARERFNSLKESGFTVSFDTVTLTPSEQIQHALKLAYIKLIQTGGFNSVDGVATPDPQADKQILDAIHTFDPAFKFSVPEWTDEETGERVSSPFPFSVGRSDCTGTITRHATLAEAEAQIVEIEKTDPEGVHAGNYYVDGPEELINPPEAELDDEPPACPVCGGPGVLLGSLGSNTYHRCRNCGADFSPRAHA